MSEEWKTRLKEHATNTAFHIQISTQMVLALGYVRDGCEHKTFCDFGRFVPAMKCIINRGLVTWHDRPKDESFENWIWYRLTPAGVAVCQLLEYAGVIKPQVEQQKKVA